MKTMNKAEQLAQDWGYEDLDEALNDPDLLFDSVAPGICMNPECDYSTEVEPDCTSGYCEICETQSVKSIHILMGVI